MTFNQAINSCVALRAEGLLYITLRTDGPRDAPLHFRVETTEQEDAETMVALADNDLAAMVFLNQDQRFEYVMTLIAAARERGETWARD